MLWIGKRGTVTTNQGLQGSIQRDSVSLIHKERPGEHTLNENDGFTTLTFNGESEDT